MRAGAAPPALGMAAATVAAALFALFAVAVGAGDNDVRQDLSAIDGQSVGQAVTEELSDPRYRLGTPWWERAIEFLERVWIRFLEWARRVSGVVGGPLPLAVAIGGVVVAMAVAVTANLGRRRARMIDERVRREHRQGRGLDPTELERGALRAEEAGDHVLAFRLLFRAALLRLDDRGLIDLRPGTTSGTVADGLGSESFHRLCDRFDAVVYGGLPAGPDDLAAVRAVLRSLLERAPA